MRSRSVCEAPGVERLDNRVSAVVCLKEGNTGGGGGDLSQFTEPVRAGGRQPSAAFTSSVQRKCACGGEVTHGGECDACRKRRQRAASGSTAREAAAPQRTSAGQARGGGPTDRVQQVLASPGQPLDTTTRAFFEPRFGRDLTRVRVHTDATALESARSINAVAYAAGRHIVYDRQRYRPDTAVGRGCLRTS